mgnify:CR=1 FL=1
MTKRLLFFHLAIPVTDKSFAPKFYTNILGCSVGRQDDKWIDFNFFGHQIVAHLANPNEDIQTNEVDNDNVPCRHFGMILTPKQWQKLVTHLESNDINFQIKPHTRFKDNPGEQHTMFIKDPSGNFLEFKAFEDEIEALHELLKQKEKNDRYN